MKTVKEFIKKNFNGRKILLPYQFWYPQIDVQRDRMKNTGYNQFLSSLDNDTIHHKAFLYIHIPFCNSRCTYCDFEKSYLCSDWKQYMDRLLAEMKQYSSYKYIKSLQFEGIYIGGGTPTLLNAVQIDRLIEQAKEIFCIDETKTVNMECSPNTLDEEKMICMKKNGVSRISMGVQSFDERTRKKFNISSTLTEVFEGIKLANKHKLDISIDLMYGFGSSVSEEMSRLFMDIDIASALEVASVELNILYPSTLIHSKDKIHLTSDEIVSIMNQAFQKLKGKGFLKTSDVTYRKKNDAKMILDESYYGTSNEIPDCIAIGSGAIGYINGYRYINAIYNRYIKNDNPITCLRHLDGEEQEKLKMIGFAKRLFLSKMYENNEYLYHNYADKIKELCQYHILEESQRSYAVSSEAQYYIDNIFYYMLDDNCKLELSEKNLIYYFHS